MGKRPPHPSRRTHRSSADFALEGIRVERPADIDRLAVAGQTFTLHIIPQAHIDLAWMWSKRDTVSMVLRTFRQHAEALEADASRTFAQSQLWAYALVERYDPALFDRIRRLVKKGQWEIVGGQWVEPDNAIPSGESHLRQLLWGQRYAQSKFGVTSRVAWCPDSFILQPASLVDLLTDAGMEFLVLKRPRERFHSLPIEPFWWQSPSGQRILTLRSNNKGGGWPVLSEGTTGGLERVAERFAAAGLDALWAPMGVGDVGGANRYYTPVEDAGWRQMYSLPTRYHAALKRHALEGLPVVAKDLGPMMAGSLTTHVEMKQLNRQAESALQVAEYALAMAAMCGVDVTNLQPMVNEAWGYVLFNQFHDVVPGTGFAEVHQEASEEYRRAISLANDARDMAIHRAVPRMVASPDAMTLVVFNSLGWERDEHITAEVDLHCSEEESQQRDWFVEDERGQRRPVHIEAFRACQAWERWTVNFVAAGLAAFGWKRYRIVWQKKKAAACVKRTGWTFQSDRLTVRFDEKTGCLVSVGTKRSPRVALQGAMGQWRLFEEGKYFLDYGVEQRAWYLGLSGKTFSPKLHAMDAQPTAEGYRVTTQHTHGQSTLTQRFDIRHGSDRIDVHVTIDWHEIEMLARLIFEPTLDGNVDAFTDGPFHLAELPNDGDERPMHTFCAIRSSRGGLAVLNNGRYGCAWNGRTLTVSAIRCATYPDPISDRGRYEFDYAIVPCAAKTNRGDLLKAGTSFNVRPGVVQPEISAEIRHEAPTTLPLTIECGATLCTAIKPTEEATTDQILRFFNPTSDEQIVTVAAAGRTIDRVTILEEPQPSAKRNRTVGKGRLSIRIAGRGIASIRVSGKRSSQRLRR